MTNPAEPMKTKPLIIFESQISKANIAKLEANGYCVICSKVQFRTPGTFAEKVAAPLALKFLARLDDGMSVKSSFGDALINETAKRLK